MRVIEIREQWSVDHIVATERATPVSGPTQVLPRMTAASLSFRDQLMPRRGYGQRSGSLPLVPASDSVGEGGRDRRRVARSAYCSISMGYQSGCETSFTFDDQHGLGHDAGIWGWPGLAGLRSCDRRSRTTCLGELPPPNTRYRRTL